MKHASRDAGLDKVKMVRITCKLTLKLLTRTRLEKCANSMFRKVFSRQDDVQKYIIFFNIQFQLYRYKYQL